MLLSKLLPPHLKTGASVEKPEGESEEYLGFHLG